MAPAWQGRDIIKAATGGGSKSRLPQGAAQKPTQKPTQELRGVAGEILLLLSYSYYAATGPIWRQEPKIS